MGRINASYVKYSPLLILIQSPQFFNIQNSQEIKLIFPQCNAGGSGSVSIPDYTNHPLLGEPIADDPLRSGPLFEASWTHALHCVSLILTFSCSSPNPSFIKTLKLISYARVRKKALLQRRFLPPTRSPRPNR
jgi:hypothetical protein